MRLDSSELEMDNHLREKRQALALSQKQLVDLAGITRQAVSALEANQYSPATSVALQLARALHCRVEDLFSIKQGGEIIEGELLGSLPPGNRPVRAQVTQIGHRLLVRPLIGIGELSSLSATADGLIIGTNPDNNRVKVKLLKDREDVRRKDHGRRLRSGDVFGRRAFSKTRPGDLGAVSDG
jgi:putative molybdopterin biosynthesis protein